MLGATKIEELQIYASKVSVAQEPDIWEDKTMLNGSALT